MGSSSALDRGRESFDGNAWREAYAELAAAAQQVPLSAEDLERFAIAARLLGRDTESGDILARAHHEFLRRGEIERAARAAIWLAFQLHTRGDLAQGSGWISRARRIIEESKRDCVEQGYLLLPIALNSFFSGDIAAAYGHFSGAEKIGNRFRDVELLTMARHGQGRALIRMGDAARGIAMLDEVMVAITSGEVSAVIAGDAYCSLIEACHEIFDMRRAQEWTTALSRWCESQPDVIAYRGSCLIRRAELMQYHGEWPDALEEALLARSRLSDPPGQRGVGAAHYRIAELHRLRGEFTEAEMAFRQASQSGRSPQPGLAMLRLAQGQVESANLAIRDALEAAVDRATRARLLAAYVEIALAASDIAAAEAGAEELTGIAEKVDAPLLRAASAMANGSVLLASGDARAALGALRRAGTAWHGLKSPYETARTGVLIAMACSRLGDAPTAEMELDAARKVFQHLGALPDLARIKDLSKSEKPAPAGGLTPREMQLLTLVATGQTNRAISTALGISEKTVARHVSNIFTKLGVASRAAATAYAFKHRLLNPPT